jgi:hypothetical protein
MAKAGEIYLNGTLLTAGGRELSIEPVEVIKREVRMASGKLKKQIVSVKHKMTLDYSYVGGSDLTSMLGIYALQKEMVLLVYHTDVAYTSYTVVMEPIKRKRVLLDTINGGLWSGVTIELEEV